LQATQQGFDTYQNEPDGASTRRAELQGIVFVKLTTMQLLEFKVPERNQRRHLLNRLTDAEKLFAVGNLDALGRSYLRSYPEFVRYFDELSVIENNNTIIASNFTFAWLPTIPRLALHLLDDVTRILNCAKRGALLDLEDFCIVQRFLGNSTVAASKLLHFVCPSNYVIWDGKVLAFLRLSDSTYPSNSNSPPSYLKFLNLCRELSDEPEIGAIRSSLTEKLRYPITSCRAIDFTMFAAKTGKSGN
jgi:hypothetical protein